MNRYLPLGFFVFFVSFVVHALEFPPVTPGRVLEFPRDAGSHPEYRIEWWYVTGVVNMGAFPTTAGDSYTATLAIVLLGSREQGWPVTIALAALGAWLAHSWFVWMGFYDFALSLVEYVGMITGLRRPIVPLGPALSKVSASVLEHLPGRLMSRDNLASMQKDAVCNGAFPPTWRGWRVRRIFPTRCTMRRARRWPSSAIPRP